MMTSEYLALQNGSDVRGIALEGVAEQYANFTEDMAKNIAKAFCVWLISHTGKTRVRVAIGHDSRISSPALCEAAAKGITETGHDVVVTGLSTTPSMFMLLKDEKRNAELPCQGSIMITASHLPFHYNGMKFFWANGALASKDVTEILTWASTYRFASPAVCGEKTERPYLDDYAATLVEKARSATGKETPLTGKKIIVDAGNGAGGFFTDKVLIPLGANTDGSQFLDPDGNFPNHIPNPENEDALHSICEAVKATNADLGIIFDADVDRVGAVDKDGSKINRNRLIALISALLLSEKAGTIVTDSVTSNGLTKFIESRGGRHHRFKRGYKNLINEAIRLNNEREYSPLAIETNGYAALQENDFLSDGAYLITRLLIALANAEEEGKSLTDLISDLEMPKEELEERVQFTNGCDCKTLGNQILKTFASYAQNKAYITPATDNYEGYRVNYDQPHGDGWALLHVCLRDLVFSINIESDAEGGALKIAKNLYYFLRKYPCLDTTALQTAIQKEREKLIEAVKAKDALSLLF